MALKDIAQSLVQSEPPVAGVPVPLPYEKSQESPGKAAAPARGVGASEMRVRVGL